MHFDVVSLAVFVDPEKGIDRICILKTIAISNPAVAECHHELMDHFGVRTEIIPTTVRIKEVCLRVPCLCMCNTNRIRKGGISEILIIISFRMYKPNQFRGIPNREN